MKSLLPASFYATESVFAHEQTQWGRLWQFVGFRRDLNRHHDFVTADIGRCPVVVQNFHGELKSFDNVCSHRFSRIQTEPCGNRALQCRYHGWAYDSMGDPVGIPQRPRFDGLESLPKDDLRLPNWRVEEVGELVFVTRDPSARDLRSYLGEAYSELEQMSQSLGTLIDVNRKRIRANWKVVIENTLEAYHVNFVHASNFKKILGNEEFFEFHSPHSLWRSSLKELVLKAMGPIERQTHRPYRPSGYVHAFLFPNLTIATTLGLTFSIQHIVPRGVGETEFTSYLFSTQLMPDGGEISASYQAVLDSAIKFNRDVSEEDQLVVEQVQLGLRDVKRSGLLSEEEVRIAAFQQDYLAQIGGIATTAP